jgi:hypothetical protein
MSQCALQSVEDCFGLQWYYGAIAAKQLIIMRDNEYCYASNLNRLLNRETIPYSYTNISTGYLINVPHMQISQELGDKTYDLTSLSEKTW